MEHYVATAPRCASTVVVLYFQSDFLFCFGTMIRRRSRILLQYYADIVVLFLIIAKR